MKYLEKIILNQKNKIKIKNIIYYLWEEEYVKKNI